MSELLLILLVLVLGWALLERNGRLHWQSMAAELQERLLNSTQSRFGSGLNIVVFVVIILIVLYLGR
jgi:hypothetical protein